MKAEECYNTALSNAIEMWKETKKTRRRLKGNPNYKGVNLSQREIIRKINGSLAHDIKRVSRTTLNRYDFIGMESRKPQGPVPLLPMVLLNTVRLHIKILQLSRTGQSSGSSIKNKLVASAIGTKYDGFDADAAFIRIRKIWPEEVAPCRVSQQESIRNEWTTYTKVNDWYSCNKRTLVDSGLAFEEQYTLPDGSIAKLKIGEQEADRIINFDETDHPLSTMLDKGGSRSIRWGDPNLPKGSQKGTRGSTHTTGLYGSTANGTAMPPCYIFESSAEKKENFRIKASWCKNLPKVRGKYGYSKTIESDSFVCARKSGCTDEELMQQLLEEVYLPLYPNVNKTTIRDEKGNFIAGPVLFKTDSGQGRLGKTWESVLFRERMRDIGALLVLGLPNSTSCTQEQDQIYQEMKVKTGAKTLELYNKKLALRSLLITDLQNQLTHLGFRGDWREEIDADGQVEPEEVDQTDENMENTNNEVSDIVIMTTNNANNATDEMKRILKRLKEAQRPAKLSNDDIPNIVNGLPSDPIKNRPFESAFTKVKI